MPEIGLKDKQTLLQATEAVFKETPDYVPLYYVRIVDAMYSLALKHEMDLKVTVSAVDGDECDEESAVPRLQVRLAELMADELQIVVPDDVESISERLERIGETTNDVGRERLPSMGGTTQYRIEVARRFRAYERRRFHGNIIISTRPFPGVGCHRPLLQYACTFEDFLRICIASGFPLPSECLELMADSASKAEYSRLADDSLKRDSESAKLGSMPLTDATLLPFGHIGKNLRWEARVEDKFLRNLPPYPRENLLTELSCREKDIAKTLEFRLAVQAGDTGELKLAHSSMNPGVYLVEPTALAVWAANRGLPLSGPWKLLLEEMEMEMEMEMEKQNALEEGREKESAPMAESDEENAISADGDIWTFRFQGEKYSGKRRGGFLVIAALIYFPRMFLEISVLDLHYYSCNELYHKARSAKAKDKPDSKSKVATSSNSERKGSKWDDSNRDFQQKKVIDRLRKATKDAIKAIATQAPRLSRHLEESIKYGVTCTYSPNPLVLWDVEQAIGQMKSRPDMVGVDPNLDETTSEKDSPDDDVTLSESSEGDCEEGDYQER